MFSAPGLILSGAKGVASRFHILSAQTRFRRYRGPQLPFSCSALPDSFSTVPRESFLVFMFCAPELIFSVAEGVGSRFHVLCALTCFRRYRGRWVLFKCFTLSDSFWQYRGRRVPFSYFARRDSFSAVPRVSGPVFPFCTLVLFFGGTGGIGSRFHVLRSRILFRRY
jgi:hypothetical protein